jgi:hypothetical protein
MIKKLISLIIIASSITSLSHATEPELVDPTDNSVTDKTHLELSAIGFAHNEYYSVINDKLLTQGDMISDYKVTKIKINQVTLLKNDNTETTLTIN